MITNYIKIAWRNISKNRVYSLINIAGLSIGITFTLLIAAYVWGELRVNTDLRNADQQYIIQSKWKDPNQGFPQATFGPLAKALKDNYPSLVANYYRYDGVSSNVSKDENSFRENIQIGDSTLLSMFGFPLLYGDAKTALQQPFTTVITDATAVKYFGKTDVVGRTLTINSFLGTKHDFQITGVLKALSRNSVTRLVDNYPVDLIVSTGNLDFFGRNMGWQNAFIANYIELQKGVKPEQLTKPIAQIIKKDGPDFATDFTPQIVSLTDLYLNMNNGLIKKMLYTLSFVALFILIMAVINFINLSVSRSASRMREIGIRKVLGGLKKQLIMQFLAESIILVCIATLIGFVLYTMTRSAFSTILIHPVPSLLQFPAYYVLFPVLFIVVVGCIAGIYPAFVLSSLRSVDTLKGKLSVKENVFMRKSLVGFQFAIAAVAFVGAIIISQQVQLFLNGDLGYNKDYILTAQLPRDWTKTGVEKMEVIRNRFTELPAIGDASLSFEIMDGNNSGAAAIYPFGTDSSKAETVQALTTDENYLRVYSVPLKAGSFFAGNASDSGTLVMNEAAVRALGFKTDHDALGQQLRIPGDATIFTIRGVTNDFHFGSMQQKVTPVAFFNVRYAPIFRYMSFKLKGRNIPDAIEAVQKKWSALMPGAPFEYRFMDDTLANVYRSELQLKKASYTATLLAFFIVLLGVVGLVSSNIQKRTKEIGIRKILGSSVPAIVSLFVKEFIWVLIVAGLVACPLAYWMMNSWLQEYAYRINITAQPFLISIGCLGIITVIIICMQTIKAAMTNPVKSLRTE